ncbi:PQQ-binding-like beta-propeller repeat protein [Flavivirga rizhaonensis]|uniref:hypothetical protein n=1 Tax=Flavivirga rizhaonensis TaxID=2559571 RepID=UPI001B87D33F|nr:hypothetical protein [Flavivirga rizhaonensis]
MNKYIYFSKFLVLALLSFSNITYGIQSKVNLKGITSIDTGYTILSVRTAQNNGESYIVANSFEGVVLGVSYSGEVLFKNQLSGYMNHDIWCGDINGDGIDEIVTANADGYVYCLDNKGDLLWKFNKNSAPMYTLCTISKGDKSYVVAGGFDKSIYYISPNGELIKEIKSSTFSIENPRRKSNKNLPEKYVSTSNFIRTVTKADGSQSLVVLGTNNHMQSPGTLYFFNIMEDEPYKKVKIQVPKELRKKILIRPLGHFTTSNINSDGSDEIILGASAHANDLLVTTYDLTNDKFSYRRMQKVKFGYDIVHNTSIKEKGEVLYLSRLGSQIRLYRPGKDTKEEKLNGNYAYNDLWKDPITNKVILASVQSGGSGVHIIDTENKNWKKTFEKLEPIGKIETILKNTKSIRKDLEDFKKPKYQNGSQTVYFMTESVPVNLQSLKSKITSNYRSPVFLNSMFMRNVEHWDRSSMTNEKYRKRRDRRKRYTLNHEEALDQIIEGLEGEPGIAYWAGHGNDPYMFSLKTTKKVIDKAKGKKVVLIYPEMEDHSENLDFLVNDLIYPLASYAQGKNANIFLRNKNIFWLGSNYLKPWSRLMSGEFADVFVPSMEETTDKSMELSLAGRTGMWASGAVNCWGTRAVPDNTSFDRSRQLGYQRLPNHFLRMLIFHTAYGAQFINNFSVDQDYMSIYWELIAKGALYVPKRSEVLSFSPVHLSIKEPDHHFIEDGVNVKWTTFYDEEFEKNNPFVFSRLNGSWPGAVVTQWDFSKYAAGVKDRRLNFLAPYENGLVLITPPQEGVFADKNNKRGSLQHNLHPIYKGNMTEYITDGRNYYSTDGKQTYKADEYYKIIEKEIKEKANLLPITVTGDVAWVVSQISPKHLRLTLIDNGYINPEKSTAKVRFNGIITKNIADILNKEVFKVKENTVDIKIPLGGFRFIDIELKENL